MRAVLLHHCFSRRTTPPLRFRGSSSRQRERFAANGAASGVGVAVKGREGKSGLPPLTPRILDEARAARRKGLAEGTTKPRAC